MEDLGAWGAKRLNVWKGLEATGELDEIQLKVILGFELPVRTGNGRKLRRWEELKFQMGWME